MVVRTATDDLLDQPVEAIVNAWNRNTIPWWLLLPQGVSGAIKRRGGTAPFRELARHGRMRLGEAVATGAGRLPFRHIIHVAALDDLWRGSERAASEGARNAATLAVGLGLRTLALPLLGSGTGGVRPERAEAAMRAALEAMTLDLEVTLVRYSPAKRPGPREVS